MYTQTKCCTRKSEFLQVVSKKIEGEGSGLLQLKPCWLLTWGFSRCQLLSDAFLIGPVFVVPFFCDVFALNALQLLCVL